MAVAGAAARVGLLGLQQRAFGEHHAKGVQSRLRALDAPQTQLDELARGELPVGDQLGLSGDPGEGDLSCVHRCRQSIERRVVRGARGRR